MVTLEGIVLWNNQPDREAFGLVRKGVGQSTVLRAVETPYPKVNPIQSNPMCTLLWCFMPYYWRARHKYRSQFAKKIHTMTDKCKYSVFTKPSYKWFIFVTKILLASSATTFAHRRTSSSNTYWLIQAKSRLNVHTATFLVQASKLKTHKLTHSGEEPFICIQCNFSCTQADNLKRHMKTHTEEKTHKCA